MNDAAGARVGVSPGGPRRQQKVTHGHVARRRLWPFRMVGTVVWALVLVADPPSVSSEPLKVAGLTVT